VTSFSDKIVRRAEAEAQKYGASFEDQSPLKERIGEYWTFVGKVGRDGGNDFPWSAAFISYMAHLAGAGSTFPYSGQHSVYVYRALQARLAKKKASFWGYRPEEVEVAPGDIIGMNRPDSHAIDYAWARRHTDYQSHCDLVVAVDGADVETIGGNVGEPGRIGRKSFDWSTPAAPVSGKQQVFVVIRQGPD
jgi:hypothetical protein